MSRDVAAEAYAQSCRTRIDRNLSAICSGGANDREISLVVHVLLSELVGAWFNGAMFSDKQHHNEKVQHD